MILGDKAGRKHKFLGAKNINIHIINDKRMKTYEKRAFTFGRKVITVCVYTYMLMVIEEYKYTIFLWIQIFWMYDVWI